MTSPAVTETKRCGECDECAAGIQCREFPIGDPDVDDVLPIADHVETIRVWAGGRSCARYPLLLLQRWRNHENRDDTLGWFSRATGRGVGHGRMDHDYVEQMLERHLASGNRIETSTEALS